MTTMTLTILSMKIRTKTATSFANRPTPHAPRTPPAACSAEPKAHLAAGLRHRRPAAVAEQAAVVYLARRAHPDQHLRAVQVVRDQAAAAVPARRAVCSAIHGCRHRAAQAAAAVHRAVPAAHRQAAAAAAAAHLAHHVPQRRVAAQAAAAAVLHPVRAGLSVDRRAVPAAAPAQAVAAAALHPVWAGLSVDRWAVPAAAPAH